MSYKSLFEPSQESSEILLCPMIYGRQFTITKGLGLAIC